MSREFNRFLLHVFMLVLILGIFSGCQNNTNQLDAEFSIGFDKSVKVTEGNPFQATITNKGDELSAELQVLIHKNEYESIVYAKEFTIPKNGTKDIYMTIPFYTIQKDIEVEIVTGNRTIYEDTVKVDKFIAPDQPIIAVISDQPDDYKFLNTVSYAYYQMDDEKMKSYSTSYSNYGLSGTVEATDEKRSPVVMYFDGFDDMQELDNLKFFNYMYIGDNTNLKFGEVTESKILDWVKQGGILIVETGEDYKRLYSFLPDSITNFDVESIVKVDKEDLFEKYPLELPLGVAKGSALDYENVLFYKEDNMNMAMYTMMGAGQIINLLVDMNQEAIKSIPSRSVIMDRFLEYTYTQSDVDVYYDYGYSKYGNMLRYIPVDKNPPYLVMAIVFALYILLAGPIMYIVLKIKDRRDLMWIGVPALSFLCLIILYIFGFGTRYNQAIVNTISEINYEDGDNFLTVKTELSVFNNKSGNLKVEWDASEPLENMSENNYYYGGNRSVIGKVTAGTKNKYEVYDSPLWSRINFKVDKTLPMDVNDEGAYVAIDINQDDLTLDVYNKSPFDLETAYVKWGNGYAYVGDIKSEEKLTFKLGMDELYADMYTMLDELRDEYNLYSYMETENEEMRANVELLERSGDRYTGYNHVQTGFDEVELVGINQSPVGYDLAVNGEEPIVFSKNIFTVQSTLDFAEGTWLDLPAGFIVPELAVGKSETQMHNKMIEYRGDSDEVIYVYEESLVKATFNIPDYFDVKKLEMKVHPAYLEYMYWDKNEFSAIDTLQGTVYEIYNPITEAYEEITELEEFFELDSDVYMKDNQITMVIRLDEVIRESIYDGIAIEVPEIRVEGSSR